MTRIFCSPPPKLTRHFSFVAVSPFENRDAGTYTLGRSFLLLPFSLYFVVKPPVFLLYKLYVSSVQHLQYVSRRKSIVFQSFCFLL